MRNEKKVIKALNKAYRRMRQLSERGANANTLRIAMQRHWKLLGIAIALGLI